MLRVWASLRRQRAAAAARTLAAAGAAEAVALPPASAARCLAAAAAEGRGEVTSQMARQDLPPEMKRQIEAMSDQVLPLSVAVQKLEAALTAESLPAEARAANQQQMAVVKTFLESLRDQRGYPPSGMKIVRFTVQRGGRLQQIRGQLKTTGGDCSRLVMGSLHQLLDAAGVHPPHVWFDGGEFTPSQSGVARPLDDTGSSKSKKSSSSGGGSGGGGTPPSPEEVAAVRAKAAAAGFPSQTITEEQFRELEAQQAEAKGQREEGKDKLANLSADLQGMEELLAVLAAVPWVPEGDKAEYIKTQVLDEVEGWGWDVRGAVWRIWRGERDAEALTKGKDAGSREAIKAILWMAKRNDEKYGLKQLPED